jgi:hypothetical protein
LSLTPLYLVCFQELAEYKSGAGAAKAGPPVGHAAKKKMKAEKPAPTPQPDEETSTEDDDEEEEEDDDEEEDDAFED